MGETLKNKTIWLTTEICVVSGPGGVSIIDHTGKQPAVIEMETDVVAELGNILNHHLLRTGFITPLRDLGVAGLVRKKLLPDSNPTAKSFWCRWGRHRWSPTTGMCEECGFNDRIWDEWEKEVEDEE